MRLHIPSLRRHLFGWACLVLLAGFSQPVTAASSPVLPGAKYSFSVPQALPVPCFRGTLDRPTLANFIGTTKAGHPVELPLLGAAWYDAMYNKMQSWLGNQRHMIQFGCIGMILALFIIWWRKT